MNATILMNASSPVEVSTGLGYLIGAAIALLILVYLLYSLIKPERF
ncbi:MAG: K(+)-transporting ATPase subunit F [Bacteroidia bacterium]|nr:K(+)-transporting ATPase subunit F [Bacteroidia bacterium]